MQSDQKICLAIKEYITTVACCHGWAQEEGGFDSGC